MKAPIGRATMIVEPQCWVCTPAGGCGLQIQGDLFSQGEGMPGVLVPF
ncbi:hypothetical protein [Niveibacterium sp.]